MSTRSADGNCRSCDAPIIWAATSRGKAMPVDVEPTAGGNVELTPHAVRPDELVAKVIPPHLAFGRQNLHMPHHATCPHGKEWKRR